MRERQGECMRERQGEDILLMRLQGIWGVQAPLVAERPAQYDVQSSKICTDLVRQRFFAC